MRASLVLAIVSGFLAGAVAAQVMTDSMARGMNAETMKAVGPAVQAVLADGKPGATRPWQTAASNGHVRLLGPDKQQPACRRVRMSSVVDGVERRGYIFRYCQDKAGQWRIAG